MKINLITAAPKAAPEGKKPPPPPARKRLGTGDAPAPNGQNWSYRNLRLGPYVRGKNDLGEYRWQTPDQEITLVVRERVSTDEYGYVEYDEHDQENVVYAGFACMTGSETTAAYTVQNTQSEAFKDAIRQYKKLLVGRGLT